jgi:DNA-binding beta-propeller fold protein YncE
MVCPGPLAVDGSGRVYVGDLGNNRVQVFDSQFRYLSEFGSVGSGALGETNQLYNASQIAVANDLVYISDPGNHRVVVFKNGQFAFAFGRKGTKQGEFTYPNGVAVNAVGEVFVADMYNNRLQKFNAKGQLVKVWGEFGSYAGQLAGPASLSAYGDELIVADAVNHRVQVFSQNGKYLYQFGRHPTSAHEGAGRLHYPMILARQAGGDLVVVCEKFEERCQLFDLKQVKKSYQDVTDNAWWQKYPYFHYRTSAQILRAPVAQSGPSVMSFVAKPAAEQKTHQLLVMSEEELHRVVVMNLTKPADSYAFGEYGSGQGQFKMPQGAHVDPFGRIWVSDTLNDRLQVFTDKGEFIKIVGARGSAPGQFNQPGELVIDREGTVYALDPGNGRVQVLDRDGTFVKQLGKAGKDVGELNFPIGMALSPDQQTLYVVELYHPRIQSFNIKTGEARAWQLYGGGDDASGPVACHIAADNDGFVYATDDSGNRVSKYSPTGEFIKAWGKLGVGPGEFYHPQGIAIDEKNRIWILDYGNHRGQIFDTNGKFISYFGDGQIGSDAPLKAPPK